MQKSTVTHFVGLDVHSTSISIADAALGQTETKDLGTIPYDHTKLLKKLDKLGRREEVVCCYEAGPTGYGLHRHLEAAGARCVVVAPTLIPQKAGERVKTDRRDAAKLARYLRAGELTPVWVPDEITEAMRDLVRARTAGKADERSARHRLGKFLLRHDRLYPGKTRWTGMHMEWIRAQKFEHEAQGRVLREYLHTVETIGDRLRRATSDIEELVAGSSVQPLVDALQALKGVGLVTASTIAVELGDLRRFPTPRQLMAYVGLVPSEHSTGNSKRRGGITKTGNKHVRTALVESAWAYRHPPRRDWVLAKRSRDLRPEILRIGWTAQHRLHRRYRRLLARGKKHQVVITAIARELLGFVSAIGQRVELRGM